MARRNGTVIWYLEVPEELDFIVRVYKESRRIQAKVRAITELLESHPELVQLAEQLYPDYSRITEVNSG